jgi:hypothetical protein
MRRALLAAALVAGGCATLAPARASGPAPGMDVALLAALPDRLATLRRQAPAQTTRSGAVMAYARPNATAAIMLSAPTALPVPDGATSATARGALAEATGDASLRMLKDAGRRGGAGRRPSELRWRSFIVHDGSATDLLCNRTTLPAARGMVTEIVCVTGVAGRVMTVGLTLTHPRQAEQEAIRLACRFAAEARAGLREAGRLQRA